jgi:hypothetical protein
MRARNYIASSACILAASLLGFWILFFVLPDVRPYTKFERVLWLVSLVLMLPTLPLLLPVAFALPPGTEVMITLVCSVISALLWPLLVGFIVRRTRGRGTEPDASPNGGPAERFGNLGVGGGPPSVS